VASAVQRRRGWSGRRDDGRRLHRAQQEDDGAAGEGRGLKAEGRGQNGAVRCWERRGVRVNVQRAGGLVSPRESGRAGTAVFYLPNRQRLSGRGCIDAGDVEWRGCGRREWAR
jgi:hypothetical protein